MHSNLTQGHSELLAKLKSMAPWHMKKELLLGVYTTDGNSESYDNEDLNHIKVASADNMAKYLQRIFPNGLSGHSFLDIGCNAGAYCIVAHQLGADYCHGFDVRDHWITQANFLKKFFEISDNELSFETSHIESFLNKSKKTFDVTLFKGVFYHLPFPVKSLYDICSITNKLIIVDTATSVDTPDDCLRIKYEHETHYMSGVDKLSWLPGGPEVMIKLLNIAGFPHCLVTNNTNYKEGIRSEKKLGRIRIIASKDPIYIENYKKSNK